VNEIATLATRSPKKDHPLDTLIPGWVERGAEVGVTPESVASLLGQSRDVTIPDPESTFDRLASAEQLADANRSQAANRAALADNWRKRRQVFAVPHPDKAARERDIYPAFQFENGKPIKAVQEVLEAFGGRKAPWKLALWFSPPAPPLT